MARSRRRTSIIGMTTAVSDKRFKVAEHRRERRTLRQSEDPQEFDGDYGDPWHGEKDGKQFFNAGRHPNLMRK